MQVAKGDYQRLADYSPHKLWDGRDVFLIVLEYISPC